VPHTAVQMTMALVQPLSSAWRLHVRIAGIFCRAVRSSRKVLVHLHGEDATAG
jgi:hypothetical protein